VSSAGTTTRSPRARTFEPPVPGTRPTEVVRSALSGMWTAIELAMLPLVLVVVVVGAILVANPPATGAGWTRTADVSATVWVVAHGVPVSVGGAAFTLVPLGVTLLVLFAAVGLGRRVLRPGLVAGTVAVVVYAALVTVATLGFAAGTGPADAVTAAVGGAFVACLGLGLGACTRPDGPAWSDRVDIVRDALVERFEALSAPVLDGVRRGTAAGVAALGLLVVPAGLLVVVWAVSGRSTVGDVLRALEPGTSSGVLLGVAQLAVLPNLVAWAMAWLVGPGFAVGDGSQYAPSGHVEGALPMVPVVGVLPGAGWANPVAELSVLVVVAVGVVVGLLAWRSHALAGGTTWSGLATSVVTTVVVTGLLVAGVETVASGAVGPGAMRHVGAQAWKVGAFAALEVGVGVLVATGWKLLDVGPRVRRTLGR
jgi:hypothetical protein